RLEELECDFAQGFLFGRPEPWAGTDVLRDTASDDLGAVAARGLVAIPPT
ncbi:MAG: hypothetical protein QOG50_3708, partial [Actinomycetota bacterium]|nr:hypothetical protein [Actinomycetota bacterium]